jgi:hypothetical protein
MSVNMSFTKLDYYRATYSGAEPDLPVFSEGKIYGFEVKFSGDPSLTKSMIVAVKDLQLSRLFII